MLSNFEQKVIEKMKEIPRGKVTTYGLLARAIRKPKAVRAVGNAVGKNPFAPRIPCHRVVRVDGTIGGYTGGVRTKVGLLKKEGVMVQKGRVANFNSKLFEF